MSDNPENGGDVTSGDNADTSSDTGETIGDAEGMGPEPGDTDQGQSETGEPLGSE